MQNEADLLDTDLLPIRTAVEIPGFIAISLILGILLSCLPLYQCYFAVEIWLLFGVELQGDAAGRGDSLQHRERVPRVFSVLQTRNHGLRGAHLLGKLGLSQTASSRISRTRRAKPI